MKKMLCLVLSLMLLFACSALAEEEKEITFQGVPWGSSAEVTLQAWIDNGFVREGMEKNRLESLSKYGLDASYVEYLSQGDCIGIATRQEYQNTIGGVYYLNQLGNMDKEIAGYKINFYDGGMTGYYACDDSKSSLLAVSVVLKADNTEEAYSDLTAKLTTVYGDYEAVNFEVSPYLYGWDGSCNVWKGANNTAVVLGMYYGEVALFYGTLDAQEILDAYYAEYQANLVPEPTVNPADTSGL